MTGWTLQEDPGTGRAVSIRISAIQAVSDGDRHISGATIHLASGKSFRVTAARGEVMRGIEGREHGVTLIADSDPTPETVKVLAGVDATPAAKAVTDDTSVPKKRGPGRPRKDASAPL